MTRSFYNLFIKPVSQDADEAEREIVLNYLLVGILALSVTAFIITLIGPWLSGVPVRPAWLALVALTILAVVGLYSFAHYRRQYRAVAAVLTSIIALSGCLAVAQWSLWDPHALLLLSLSVVMAGILIGARYSIYMTAVLTLVLIYLQQGEQDGFLHPDRSWLRAQPILGDVLAISSILFIIAFVSWLFNRQMELSLHRARRSEKALKRQKQLLEVKVEKRARQLEAAQLEKMQELYRFAELGRLSTALFHDLANHLSTVSLDIEGLSGKDQSDIMRRISQNVGHIDTIVRRVREQIRGKSTTEVFNVQDEIDEVLKIVEATANQARVTITIERGRSVRPGLTYRGDVIRFRQIILNLLCNGVEAYPASSDGSRPRTVVLRLERQGRTLSLEFIDHGVGIPAKDLPAVFRPFYTTKATGVGIGLFIVKQVVEQDFGGTIDLVSGRRQGTTVMVTLPKSYYARTA